MAGRGVRDGRMQRFEGFGPEVFDWFEGLLADNSKAYFEANRATYDGAVRGALERMLEELAVEFGGDVKVFRQQRNLRFSRDKTPYKTTTAGVLHDTARMHTGFYAQLSADGLFAGTGYPHLSKDQLERYRQAVDDDRLGTELAAAVSSARDAGLGVEGRGLKSAPRGFPRDHPRIELLRRTGVIAGRSWPNVDGIAREDALAGVAFCWRAAGPMVGWLDEHVGAPLDDRD